MMDTELNRDLHKLGYSKPAQFRNSPGMGQVVDMYAKIPKAKSYHQMHTFHPFVVEDVQMVLDDLTHWGNKKVEAFAKHLTIELVTGRSADGPLLYYVGCLRLEVNYARFANMSFEERYNAICSWVSKQIR